MYSHPSSLNGDQETPFERTACKSTATYIKSAVQTHWKTSLEEMPTVWMQEKKKRHCIVSKPSLSLSSERSPQAEDVAFQTCRDL